MPKATPTVFCYQNVILICIKYSSLDKVVKVKESSKTSSKMSLFRGTARSYYIKNILRSSLPGSNDVREVGCKNYSNFRVLRQSAAAEEAITPPQSETTPPHEKSYSPKITTIVDQISALNLLEVADLNELLKAKLKIR